MKKNKSVAFLCQFFYPELVSSATLPFDTAEFLAENGFDVFCLCGAPKEYLGKRSKIPKLEVVRNVKIRRIKYWSLSRKSLIGRVINFFSFTVKCLFNLGKLKGYDYLFVYSNPPILPYVAYKAHKRYGCKVVFVCYDVYPEIAINTGTISPGGMITKIMSSINKRLFSCVYRVVALSDDMKSHIIANRAVDSSKVVVIPNWFDRIPFVPKEKTSSLVVTYLGNLGVCQDIQTILDCAFQLKDEHKIRFVLGGHGSKLTLAQTYIDEHHLANIKLYPFLSGDDYSRVMNQSDCFIVSLERKVPGLCFPSKYYSYLAYGRPVIAISESGSLTNDISEHGVGYCVANGDGAGLAKALKAILLMEPDAFMDTALRARNLFEECYAKEKSLSKYLDALVR
ncbi:MAG: glycosyltransferase family 4 protein [Bacilli bacterium]|nr:glycosyltransferase family 4 protein [Bacilli bacterium]